MLNRLQATRRILDARCPANRQHPLNRGRIAWWRSIAGRNGPTWFDLAGTFNGALTNMASATLGFVGPVLVGGDGPSISVGTSGNPYVDLGQPYTGTTASFTYGGTFLLPALPGINQTYNIIGWADNNAALNASLVKVSGSNSSPANHWSYSQSGTTLSYSVSALAGVPLRVIFTNSSKVGTFYVNGVVVGPAHAFANNPSSTTHFSSGNLSTIVSTAWAGYVDDLFFANRPWTQSEVTQDYILSQQGYPGVLNRMQTTAWLAKAQAAASPVPWGWESVCPERMNDRIVAVPY